MTPLRKRMIDDMVSAGLSPATRYNYFQAVRGLAKHYNRSPDALSEAEVRSYLLHLRDERGIAHGTFQPVHAGIQFLYVRTLDRDWPLFSKKESKPRNAAACRASCRTPRLASSSAVSSSRSPGSAVC